MKFKTLTIENVNIYKIKKLKQYKVKRYKKIVKQNKTKTLKWNKNKKTIQWKTLSDHNRRKNKNL